VNICVAGWYFHKPLMPSLSTKATFWVCHRHPPVISPFDYIIIRNVGLEFGCYDWYLKNKWPGGDTLFLHDDNEITQEALDQIVTIPHDQCFLFSSEQDAKANGRAHGRAFFMSDKLLRCLKDEGGFWYDEGPSTSMPIPATHSDEPNYHNLGIQTFVAWLKLLPRTYSANQIGIVPGLKTGYRGRI
jgi:hypothetical protein